MKTPYKYLRKLTLFSPAALFVLTALYICSGCDTKQPMRSGNKAPEISGYDIQNRDVSLSRLQGSVVVLFFWTNSCCGERVKQLEPFSRRFKEKGVAVLAVNVGDSRETVASYAQTNGVTFPLKTDEHAGIARQYGVFGFPTTFLIDRNGIIRQRILGDVQVEQLQKLVERQLDRQNEVEANYEKLHRR